MKRTKYAQCNRCARRNCKKKVKQNCKFYEKPEGGFPIEEIYRGDNLMSIRYKLRDSSRR